MYNLLKRLYTDDGTKFEDTLQYDEVVQKLTVLDKFESFLAHRCRVGSYIEPDNLCIMIFDRYDHVAGWIAIDDEKEYEFYKKYFEDLRVKYNVQ